MTRRRTGGGRGLGRRLLMVLALMAAFATVPWRQTRGAALEQELRKLDAERAVLEAERHEQARHAQQLSSRSRVVRVARERLGMRLPDDGEILFLPVVTRRDPSVEARNTHE